MRYLLFILVFILVFSCQDKKTSCTDCKEEEMIMYEPSELASLMLEMYDANKDWKDEILKGNIPSTFPEKYKEMHSAESINENAGSEFYNAMTDTYLKSIEDLTHANAENVQERYNNMVNVCLQCHQQICPGPVSKINKLIIK